MNPATLLSIGTLSCRLSISALTFCLNLVFDVSFLIVIASVFHFRMKLRTIEPLLHFDLHVCSKNRLWVRLFAIIGTFFKNLKCLLERFLVCWRILKNLFNDTRVIWSSAGRILVPRSRSLAVFGFYKTNFYVPVYLFVNSVKRVRL